MPKAPKLAYYAVRRGHQPGIYFSWEDCRAQIKGFAGAIFKKFPTAAEAEAFITAETGGSHALAWGVLSTPTTYQPVTSTSAAAAAAARITQSTSMPDLDEKEFDVVYCDGACKGNGGSGPKAGIGVWWGHNDPRNLSERCPGDQTNNRAELLWMTNGFRTADGQPVKNRALIKYLAALLHARRITSQTIEFKHVRGHAGLEGNEAADQLANIGVSQPPLPERDWEQLERNVSKNIEREKEQLDEYNLQVL
ncbi:ribonuclease H-like domain-containing protein [Pisolithus croceorrhizus]|nr:ribonuclease H-like domain-containing protein [Pisolithus croceorrhizus]KAI6114881.1 ribonuclease H-like domain-containing protein [Pisolithus croceorrhizus]